MSLRLKLFLPLLLLASLLTAYVGVYGLPQFRSGIEMQQREQLRQQLAGIAEGLTAQLEQGRRSSVGRRLDALLENNPA
jgi:hypothetical protein